MLGHEYDSLLLSWQVSWIHLLQHTLWLHWLLLIWGEYQEPRLQPQTKSFYCDMLRLDDVKHGIGDSEALVATEQDNWGSLEWDTFLWEERLFEPDYDSSVYKMCLVVAQRLWTEWIRQRVFWKSGLRLGHSPNKHHWGFSQGALLKT